MMFYLYYVAVPLGVFILLVLLMYLGSIARKKSPKVNQQLEVFEGWLREVYPNKTQKEAIVLFAIIGVFVWMLVR
jgi:hypothetical protein